MVSFLEGIMRVEYPVAQVFGKGIALGTLEYPLGIEQVLTMMKASKEVGLLILDSALTCVEE